MLYIVIDIQLFFSKVPHSIEDVMPGKGKLVTYLSHLSYYDAVKSSINYAEFDYICLDCLLDQKIYNLIHLKPQKTLRISPDMTSLAPILFNYAVDNNLSVCFLGTKQIKLNSLQK